MFLEMTLTELRDIAKAGKTAKRNIEIGDTFLIKKTDEDANIAKIVAIGNDYITCTSTDDIIYVPYYDDLPFDDVVRGIVGYPDSHLQFIVKTWYEAQSDEFKSVIKDTDRTYEIHSLWAHKDLHNFVKYNQTFLKFKSISEKVFVPTKYEVLSYGISETFNGIWTSTPFASGNSQSSGQFLVFHANHLYSFDPQTACYIANVFPLFRIG